jgi:CubicO group peptidase (beta-lactamase class C family)
MIKQLTILLLAFTTPVFSQDKPDELISAYVKMGSFNGSVLVAQHGQILLKKNYGLDDAHAVYQIASVTKTFTSALTLKLNELHLLSLTDKLSKYYPGYPKGDSITIQQLLTHTSGVYNYTMNSDFMNTAASKPIDEEKMLALFKDQPLDFSPGTGWNYSNSGYMLLGYISQKVTHLSYQEAIRKYIFKPLNMNHSGFDFAHLAVRATGYYADSANVYNKLAPMVDSSVSFAAGSIYSSVEDLYKWHTGLEHYQIIHKASTEKALTLVKNNYGYGWQIDSLYGHKIVYHGGGIWGFRSNFTRVPEDDICIVLLSNIETPVLESISKKLLAIHYHQPYEIPFKKTSIKLTLFCQI